MLKYFLQGIKIYLHLHKTIQMNNNLSHINLLVLLLQR